MFFSWSPASFPLLLGDFLVNRKEFIVIENEVQFISFLFHKIENLGDLVIIGRKSQFLEIGPDLFLSTFLTRHYSRSFLACHFLHAGVSVRLRGSPLCGLIVRLHSPDGCDRGEMNPREYLSYILYTGGTPLFPKSCIATRTGMVSFANEIRTVEERRRPGKEKKPIRV